MQVNTVKKTSPLHGFKSFTFCLLLAFFSVSVITTLTGQCITSSSLTIPDDGITSVHFIVSGLIDGNLASPTQGICGVDLDFMHEYLGDLTITLISPSGISIELIGPVTTAITPTNLSRWNIRFVPCLTMPSPDAGFTPVWSNLQPWQFFTPYSGSYHPQSGCLEDFNSGPANGVWQLIIEDHDVFATGTLASATIIFCNPAGLQCGCNPNAGTLSPAMITRCVGQNISSSEIIVDFGGNPPPSSSYSYQFLMTMGSTIVRSGSFFSDTPPIGNYSICGLSYLTVDSMEVNNLLATGDYNQLIQALAVGTICADIASLCVSLHVLPVPDTTDLNINLCKGEAFSFGGQNYSLMGTYYQTHDGPGLCDSIFQIRIFTSELDIDFSIPDSLNCGNGEVMISSFVSGNIGPVTYEWSTLIGSITSPSDLTSVTVDQPGQYFLSVSDAICNKVEEIIVFADQGFPQAFVEGGQITCSNPAITLDPIYIPTNATILWTGPMGFVSNLPEISVSVPGIYLLTVTNQTGCSTTRPVTVTIDTSTVDFQIVSLGKNCQDGYIVLGSTFESLVSWDWRGPNNFLSNYWRPSVSTAGNYTLTGIFPNGCQHIENYFFDGDFLIPDIMVSPRDTLHCNEMISLSVTSSTPGVTYAWSGPEGFSSTIPTIQITQAGNYFAVVNAPNGCNTQEEVIIDLGDDIFDYQTITDTLNCVKDTIEIGVISPEADLYKWIGFSGPDSLNPFIAITSAGIYTVMMTDTNSGCQIVVDVLVTSDFKYPSFGYTTDTITCDLPIAQLSFVPFQGFNYSNVFWLLPDQTIVPGPVLMSSLPGEFLLIGVSPNGCTGIWHIHIPFDTIGPQLFIEAETLGCDDTVDIVVLTLDSVLGYQWTGPGIVLTGTEHISVNEPGIYHLTATGLNGCSSEFDIDVDSNFSTPIYELTIDSLRCDSPATIEVNSFNTLADYLWMDSSGDILSYDSIVQVNSPGFYTIEIRGINNCKALDTVFIQPLQYPSFNIVSDTLTCGDTLVTIQVSSNSNPVTYRWSDIDGNLISMSNQIEVSQVGPFILSVSDHNACETLDTILIPVDTIPPVAIVELLGEVRCQSRDIMFDGTSSSPNDIIFLWTTEGGGYSGRQHTFSN